MIRHTHIRPMQQTDLPLHAGGSTATEQTQAFHRQTYIHNTDSCPSPPDAETAQKDTRGRF